jgi:hypothetical protein
MGVIMNLQFKKLLTSTMIMLTFSGFLFSNNIVDNQRIYLGVANNIERVVSIDLADFGNPTLPTNGSNATYDSTACELPIRLVTGATATDTVGFFRTNDNTRFLRINFGSKKITGFQGYITTTASTDIRLSINTTPGTQTYVRTNTATFTVIATGVKATTANVPLLINRVNLNLTGEIEIRTTSSTGWSELIFYYTE